jgi:hypothetical protein
MAMSRQPQIPGNEEGIGETMAVFFHVYLLLSAPAMVNGDKYVAKASDDKKSPLRKSYNLRKTGRLTTRKPFSNLKWVWFL